MPRGPRLDAPGALHHVIVRGIERRAIFRDDADRQRCLDRLGTVISIGGGGLYAWCLMPNHVHALIRTGAMPLSRLMRRWLSPYATAFNRRYRRCGYLFQNRFKSILVEEECYLLELVRYIHLNPVRSRLPIDLDDLDTYRWTGHAVLLGRQTYSAQDTDFVLAHFGSTVGAARGAYREFVRTAPARPVDLSGGGLRRSAAGWEHHSRTARGRERWAHDERILGRSTFVQAVLAPDPPPSQPVENAATLVATLCERVAQHFGIRTSEIASPSQRSRALAARAIVCHFAVCRHGLSLNAVGRCLGVSRQSVARAIERATPLLATAARDLENLLR